MSVVHMLDSITAWVQAEICPKLSLKVPPDAETAATDEGYEYERVTPTAFALYVPTKEKLPPPIVSPFPSVCVRIIDGADDLGSWRGVANLQLCFSTWSTGTHGKDVVLPNEADKLSPRKWTGPEAEAYFRRSGDGWRDAWNMIDVTLRALESVSNIDGIVIKRDVPVKYGPLTEQEAIPDYYPFWFSWVSFSVQYPIIRAGLEEFL